MNKADRVVFLGSLFDKGQSFAGAIFDKNYLCPTLTTMQGGWRQPLVIYENTKK